MIPTQLLTDRPVAYHPDLARILGGVKCTIFLCQLLYWSNKGARADGFIWKTQKEMEKETGLSRYEQEGARKKLIELEVLEEKLAGLPACLHYRVNFERLEKLITEYYSKQECGEPADKIARNQQTVMGKSSELFQRIPENTTDMARCGIPASGDGVEEFIAELKARSPPARDPPRSEQEYLERVKQAEAGWLVRQAGEPWRAWGAESRYVNPRAGVPKDAIQRIGYLLETEFGLAPPWGIARRVKDWVSGLAELYQVADGDCEMIRLAAHDLRRKELTLAKPQSLFNTVSAMMAERRSNAAGARVAEW